MQLKSSWGDAFRPPPRVLHDLPHPAAGLPGCTQRRARERQQGREVPTWLLQVDGAGVACPTYQGAEGGGEGIEGEFPSCLG